MTNLLIKIFIKDKTRTAYGKLSGWVGIVCNLMLCALKFTAGLLAGSISITADAANNLSDASSSIISLFGFKLSEKSADEEHPYGHARYEYISGFIVAILVIVIGIELLKSGIGKIINPEPIEFGVLTVIILVCSIAVKLWMMVFNNKMGKLINSGALKATAADSRNDAVATSAVLAAAVISEFTPLELDGWMAVLVALFIIYSGAGLVKDAMSPLLGKAPDPELVEKIKKKIMSYPGVLGTHDLMVHDYGPGRIFASVHVEMAAETDVLESHDVIDNIEHDFLKNEGLNMVVHLDPIVTKDSSVRDLRKQLSEIASKIDGRLTIHDLRIVPGNTHTNIIFDCVLPARFSMTESAVKEEFNRFVRLTHPEYCCIITFDRSYAPIPKSHRDEEEEQKEIDDNR